jgi:hypothetical protein
MDTFFFDLKLYQAAAFVGICAIILGLMLMIMPGACRAYIPRLGRHLPTAWTLAAIDLLWVAWIVNNASLGRFDAFKPGLYIVTPLCFFLVIRFVDELLGARALGGLLLLMANPVLNAARWLDTPWRFVMTILAYGWAVLGMALTLSPYLWRRWTAPLLANDVRARIVGAFHILSGFGFLFLAWSVY